MSRDNESDEGVVEGGTRIRQGGCDHEPVMQGADRLHVGIIPIDYSHQNINGEPTLDTDNTIEACVCMHCFAVYVPEDSMGELGKIAAGKDPPDPNVLHDFRIEEVSLVDKPPHGHGMLVFEPGGTVRRVDPDDADTD